MLRRIRPLRILRALVIVVGVVLEVTKNMVQARATSDVMPEEQHLGSEVPRVNIKYLN